MADHKSYYIDSTGQGLDVTSLVELTLGEGKVGVEHTNLEHVIQFLIQGLNSQQASIKKLHEEAEKINDTIQAVEQTVVQYDGMIRDCEEMCQQAMLQSGGEATGKINATDAPEASTAAFTEVQNTCTSLEQRLTKLEEQMWKEVALLKRSNEEGASGSVSRISGLEETAQEVKNELEMFEDTIEDLKQKMNEDVIVTIMRLEQQKVNKSEIEALSNSVDALRSSEESIQQRLQEAQNSLHSMVNNFSEIEEAKNSVKDLSNWVRGSMSDMRQWASTNLEEVRRDLHDKACAVELKHSLAELRQNDSDTLERIGTLTSGLTVLNSKAEKTDLMHLKEVVASVAAETRRREGVLFGARCLSCNRVFDDTGDVYANQIDLQAEKSKHAIFSHVQNKLNDPVTLNEDVKLLSVKVGKPSQKIGDDKQLYQTREASYGSALEDVHLLLKRDGRRVNEALRVPRVRPSPRENLKLPSPTNCRNTDPQSDDFKHSLSALLGRDRPSATALNDVQSLTQTLSATFEGR